MADDPKVLSQEDKFVDANSPEYKAEIANKVKEELEEEFDTKLEKSKKVIQEEATKEAAQKAREVLAESLVGKPPKEEKISWKKEGRNPKDYVEVAEEGAKLAEERVLARLKAEKEEAKKKSEQTKAETEKRNKLAVEEANKRWDTQLENLTTQGKIPEMSEEAKNKFEKANKLTGTEKVKAFAELRKEDEGFEARMKIQELAYENNVKGETPNLELTYYKYYNKQPAGANAPVFGTNKSVSQSDGEGFAYEDIQGKKASEVYQEVNS